MTIGEIYAEHAPAIFRCLLVWSRNAAIAEDLTAETFYRAIVSGQAVHSMTARGYLIAIARPACVIASAKGPWSNCSSVMS
jgi:DNA-directed RNA polymerase specialized sigma24 family protein